MTGSARITATPRSARTVAAADQCREVQDIEPVLVAERQIVGFDRTVQLIEHDIAQQRT